MDANETLWHWNMESGESPRRGRDYDLFDCGDFMQLQSCDSIDPGEGEDPDSDPPRRLEDDGEAAYFVLCAANDPDAPEEVQEECRETIREMVASWNDPKLGSYTVIGFRPENDVAFVRTYRAPSWEDARRRAIEVDRVAVVTVLAGDVALLTNTDNSFVAYPS